LTKPAHTTPPPDAAARRSASPVLTYSVEQLPSFDVALGNDFAVNEHPVAVKNDEIDVQWHPSFLSTDQGKKIAHIGDRAYSPVLTEKVTVFRQAMFSAAKADRCHSRRDCRLNPSYAVLDDEATRRSRPHTPRGMKKQVGGGLPACDHRRAEQMRFKSIQQPHDPQTSANPLRNAARGNADRHVECSE
jgi:hypothetical protein